MAYSGITVPSYASLDQLKTHLGVSGTAEDTLLTSLLAAADDFIHGYTGRWFSGVAATLRFDHRTIRGRSLFVDTDLLRITSMTNGDGSLLVPEDYVLLPRNRTPSYEVALTAGRVWYTEQAIEIVGVWGYADTPPAGVVQAALEYAGGLYRSYDRTIHDMPVVTVAGAERLLRPYRRVGL